MVNKKILFLICFFLGLPNLFGMNERTPLLGNYEECEEIVIPEKDELEMNGAGKEKPKQKKEDEVQTLYWVTERCCKEKFWGANPERYVSEFRKGEAVFLFSEDELNLLKDPNKRDEAKALFIRRKNKKLWSDFWGNKDLMLHMFTYLSFSEIELFDEATGKQFDQFVTQFFQQNATAIHFDEKKAIASGSFSNQLLALEKKLKKMFESETRNPLLFLKTIDGITVRRVICSENVISQIIDLSFNRRRALAAEQRRAEKIHKLKVFLVSAFGIGCLAVTVFGGYFGFRGLKAGCEFEAISAEEVCELVCQIMTHGERSDCFW